MTPPALDWKERYRDKMAPPAAALKRIRSGDTVFIGTGAAQPQTLCEALTAMAGQVHDVEIRHLLTIGEAPYIHPDLLASFRVNTFFVAPNVRDAVNEGIADYTPIFLSDIPGEFASGRIPIDVALIQTSPPDANGFMTFGVSLDIVKSAAENARFVVAEVNDHMPRVLGDTLIHVNEVDALVPVSRPLSEYVMPEPDDTIRRIGRYLADLIDHGATVQFGIGRIPQAVAELLCDKRDLGVHTEMFTDSLMDLIRKGVVTCTQKTINRGKVVASFCMGSRELYEFVDNNPFIEFYPTEYVNDPFVIAQHMDMISINVGLEVDLSGQVCADSLGHRFYSGFGGQVDFVRGAARAKNGKAIIAMPSTARGDTLSRIVPLLSPGAGVTTTRGDVHYVVTEFGVAYLHGKSVQERALALINIAHPAFRNALLREAKRYNYVRREQGEISVGDASVTDGLRHRATLSDGTEVRLRTIRATDDRALRDMLYSLSPESIYYRFFQPLKQFSFEARQKLVNVNLREELAIVACLESPGGEEIIGVGRYIREPGSNAAEVAFLVQDEWQNKKLGSHLLACLTRMAKASGISTFHASVLRDNKAMLGVFHSSGFSVQTRLDEDVYRLTVQLTT